MKFDLTTILILLGVLFVGYGIGLLEMHLRRQKKIKQLEAALNAQPAAPELKPVVPAAPPADPGLLRLSAGADQSLKLELDGVSLVSPASTTPEQRRRLVTLLNDLRPWVEGGPVAPVAKTNTATRPEPVELLPVMPPTPVPAVPVFTRAKTPPQPELATRSIVGQINDILQTRMVGTPLASRQVRLGETPAGGVLVYIGMNHYESLDTVPDQEVLAAIRAATAEWEKKVK